MRRGRITVYEVVTCGISLIALVVSMWSVYLQFHKTDDIVLRVNPVSYNGLEQKFEFAAVNLGTAAGMVSIKSLTILNPGSNTKGATFIPIDHAMVIKPSEMETFSFTTNDAFNSIQPDNQKHGLAFAMTYLGSDGKSKSGKFNFGFISMSGSKKTIYSDRGYLYIKDLPKDKGGQFFVMDDKHLKYGNPQMGFDQVEHRIETHPNGSK
jgi:hypothetical protein